MGNNKMIKTAAAVALGASVVATAVAPGAASAAATYKLKSGKLVNAKTGKVVKGYKVYKSTLYKDGKKAKGYVTSGKVLYKNGKKFTGLRSAKYYKAGKLATGTFKGVYYKTGKKFTGLKSGVYYKAGVKGTGSYKSVYYKKGKKHTGLVGATYYKAGKKGTGEYKGIQYKAGKAVNGLSGDTYYKNGVKASGEVDGVQYFDGAVANGTFHSKLYVDGKVFEGTKEGKLYVAGKVFSGVNAADQKVYVDGVLDETAPAITVAGAQKVAYGASIDEASFVTSVKDNSGEEIKAVVTSSKIDTTKPGNYTVTYTATDKNGNVGKASVEVTVQAPAVESVKAINAEEIKVTFKQKVGATALNKGNYSVELNGNQLALITPSDVQFVDGNEKGTEGTTVIVRLPSALSAGDKVVVQVKDEVKTVQGTDLERYASDIFTFDASAKPVLKSVKPKGTQLEFTFDRPVNLATGLIKVDGVALATSGFVAQTTTKAGDYTYTTANSFSSAEVKELREGTHEVTIFDVEETARSNAQKQSSSTASYTISKDEQAPEVKSVTAVNANKFTIKFTEAVNVSASSFTIKQGNHTYDVETDWAKAATEADSKAYISAINVATDEVTVVIPDQNTKTYANPLYINGATTANLDVTVKAFKDVSNLVGIESTKSVTLKKGDLTPQVTQTVITKDASDVTNGLTITLDAPVNYVKQADFEEKQVVVKNADGVVIPYKDNSTANANYSATVSGNIVTIAITNAKYKGATSYTATIKEDAVKYLQHLTTLAGYNFEENKNKELTASASVTADSNFKYFPQSFGTTPVPSTNNVFEVKFDKVLTDSALEVSNYTLDGKALPAGTKLEFVGDKSSVRFTLPAQSVKSSTHYKLAVSTKVQTADNQSVVNNLRDLDSAVATVKLTDNTSAKLVSAKYLVANTTDTSSKTLALTFDEELANLDADDLKVLVGASTVKAGISSIKVGQGTDKNIVVVTLTDDVNVSQPISVTVVKGSDNEITSKDSEGNKVAENTTATAAANVTEVNTTLSQAGATATAVAAANAEIAKVDLADPATITAAQNKVNAIPVAADKATAQATLNKAVGEAKQFTPAIISSLSTTAFGDAASKLATATVDQTANKLTVAGTGTLNTSSTFPAITNDGALYVSFDITAPTGFTATDYVLGNGNASSKDGANNAYVILSFNKTELAATNKTKTLSITWKDAANKTQTVVYTIDFSELKAN